jgi:prephenate dehydrogenase
MVTTAIIGAGKMGVWFANFCKENGEHVILADRNRDKLTKLSKEFDVETADLAEAVQEADNIILCVSISAFEDVVKKIAPYVREGQNVLDICSVKEHPVKIMHRYIKGPTVLGTHPVFGPGSKNVRNKAYILTPTNGKEEAFAKKYKDWLEKVGARVFIMSPEKHDQLMSIVLGLPHFVGLVACDTLLEQPVFDESKKVAGTTYRMLFTLAEATALETPDLYANLQTNLPDMGRIEQMFIEKAEEWLRLVKKKDTVKIVRKLEKLKTKLVQIDSEFEKSYETMYKMLEAAEK